MVRHIFLTGEKQAGKSTLLSKVLDRYTGSISGFFTVRTKEFLKDNYSVHIFGTDEKKIPNESNFLFVCGNENKNVLERFNHLGCKLLAECSDSSLIVMDELGPHEEKAILFRNAVLKLLDSDRTILGVLQTPAEKLWPEITKHPGVQLFHVTRDKREQEELIEKIISIINS